MNIRKITDDHDKKAIAGFVLESLPEWFGIPESRDAYIQDSAGRDFFCAYLDERPVGFLYLKQTGTATAELAVMGVMKEHHRRGIGRALFEAARKTAREKGYSFMQVKTVQMGKYECYDTTNRFYLSLGFQEFEVLPQLWDEENPCQIYVMAL